MLTWIRFKLKWWKWFLSGPRVRQPWADKQSRDVMFERWLSAEPEPVADPATKFGLWLARPLRSWRRQRRSRAVEQYRAIYPGKTEKEIERSIFGDNL
jgi:hypothetical protein